MSNICLLRLDFLLSDNFLLQNGQNIVLDWGRIRKLLVKVSSVSKNLTNLGTLTTLSAL